ncbi:hypothetical protein PGB90_008737 [Kerria lacca]
METFVPKYFDSIVPQRNLPVAAQYNSFKIDKAVKFLCLPEIKKLSPDFTKAQFLKSKGLSQDEIFEAFQKYHKFNFENLKEESVVPRLILNAVSHNDGDRYSPVVQYQRNNQGSSSFFSFCQKLILIASITSTCYYLYQKWLRLRMNKRKTEKTIKDELNQIRNELAKISNELRQQQTLERNQVNLLSEINSLKAILVGRQYFQEKQASKISIPSWQLHQNNVSIKTNRSSQTTELFEVNKDKGNFANASSSAFSEENNMTAINYDIPTNVSFADGSEIRTVTLYSNDHKDDAKDTSETQNLHESPVTNKSPNKRGTSKKSDKKN